MTYGKYNGWYKGKRKSKRKLDDSSVIESYVAKAKEKMKFTEV